MPRLTSSELLTTQTKCREIVTRKSFRTKSVTDIVTEIHPLSLSNTYIEALPTAEISTGITERCRDTSLLIPSDTTSSS